jgi:hypothetical protein
MGLIISCVVWVKHLRVVVVRLVADDYIYTYQI